MTDGPDLGSRALAHVKALAESIGPRPAGSPAERQALDYAAGLLEGWGYQVRRQPVAFAKPGALTGLYVAGALGLAAGVWAAAALPWLALLLPIWVLGLPQVGRWWIQRAPRSGTSENVIATWPGANDAATVMFCAHVDSAPAGVFSDPRLSRLYSYAAFAALRLAWLTAALGLLKVIGFMAPGWLDLLVALAGTLLGGAWALVEFLNGRSRRYAPGANDNASGVGAALAAAEELARRPVKGSGLAFLFTGAEETGLHGAEAYAETCTRESGVWLVNLDMVGIGRSLRLVDGDGTLRPRATSPALNKMVKVTAPAVREVWYNFRSGDYLPFLRRGLPATSIQTSGGVTEAVYHTLNDTVEHIDPRALAQTAELVVGLARQFPADPRR